MKILFIQVGDIHWRNDNPIDQALFDGVGPAIRNIYLSNPDCVFFVYTGDFAHSGKTEEYIEVYRLLEALETGVKNVFPDEVVSGRVGVPGNHDCDFNIDQTAREQLLAYLEKGGSATYSGQVIDVVLTVQNNYWDFADAFVLENQTKLPLWDNVDSRLAWSVAFSINGCDIRFKCFNTAWLSRLHEKQGALLLPTKDGVSKQVFDLDLSLFHHPLTWIESVNSRTSRENLLASSDIVFTGHEHEAGSHRLGIHGKGEASIFEGGALWEPKLNTHEFSILLLDTDKSESEYTSFSWEDGSYKAYRDDAPYDPGHPNLPLQLKINRFRRNAALDFSESQKQFLERSEIDLTHGKQDKLRLSDLFVFPDLAEVSHPTVIKSTKVIEGPKVQSFLMNKGLALIMGPDGSGKTAIAKQWCRISKIQGLLPLLLDGRDLPSNESALLNHLRTQIMSQYGLHTPDSYLNSATSEKIVVIDDFDKIPRFWLKDHKIITCLNAWFGRIVFIANDLAFGPLQIGKFLSADDSHDGKLGSSRAALLILPFSTDRKNELIEKWLSLDTDSVEDPQLYSRRFYELNRLMDAIVGREYLQPYPPYILALLQGNEAGIDLDLSTSTHGFLYEVFIKTALAKRSSGTNHNIFTSFVSFLAFRCLREEKKQFGDDFFKEVHTWFEDSTDLTRDIDTLKTELLSLRFLSNDDGTLRFGEKYIFYYFAAFYIKDYIDQEEIREFVQELASKLWVEDYANVMLFLTHLSKNRHIANSVITAAGRIFHDVSPATLDESNLQAFQRMASDVPMILSPEVESTAETRREAAKLVADEVTLPSSDLVSDGREVTFEQVSILAKFNAAVKTIQILGQMLKNFPANFSPAEKVAFIDSCIDLGMRTFTVYIDLVHDEAGEAVNGFAEMLRLKKKSESPEVLEEEAKRIIFHLVYLVAFGITKRISYAIGSSELERSYERVFSRSLTSARKLVKISLSLDHTGAFPERIIEEAAAEWKKTNPFALRLLKGMVRRHFKQFHVGFATRQRVCNMLEISFKKISTTPSGQRLVGG